MIHEGHPVESRTIGTTPKWLLGLVLAVVGLGGCAASPATTNPLPTWPVSPEQLPNPTSDLSPDFGPATWALDPAFPTSVADTSELRILVWERACSGGSPASGRNSTPVVQYTGAAVTITLGVRPLEAAPGTAFSCRCLPGRPRSYGHPGSVRGPPTNGSSAIPKPSQYGVAVEMSRPRSSNTSISE